MFRRVTIGVSDLAASRRFYATTLAALGIGITSESATEVVFGDFAIVAATAERPVTSGLHVGFASTDRAAAERFWRAGVNAGFRDDGAPGPRPAYGPDYFGAFLLDPDGNSAEAALHDNVVATPAIDHLWIRVADLAAGRGEYEQLGWPVVTEQPGLVRFRAAPKRGSFTLLEGEPVTGPFALALD